MATSENRYALVKLNPAQIAALAQRRAELAVKLAAEKVKVQVQRNISEPSRPNRSQPGEFPHADTGRLRNTIFWRMVGPLTAIVGTNLNYGIWLEFGVVGEKTIYAERGKVFRWLGANGEVIYRKSFTFRGLKARPFLRPTLLQMLPAIGRTFAQAGLSGTLSIETKGA